MNTHPRIQAVNERHAATLETRRSFEALKNEAARLLQQAYEVAALGGLSDTEAQQALAASKIAGVTFRPITIPVDAQDFERLADDLRHVAAVVDQLFAAIGADAESNSTVCTAMDFKAHFSGVIANAIEGNTLWVLEECADAERETERSDFDEHNTLTRAQQG